MANNLAAFFKVYCYNDGIMSKTDKTYKTLDLFAGIGGVRIGFERAGFETVFGNDFDPYCKATYDLNFKNTPLRVADIAKVKSSELPDFDILLGGFPCQPFSIAGYRRGFLDTGRGDLFFEIVRIIRDKKPKAIFLENVKNLKSHDKGKTFKIISDALADLGYHVKVQVLNSMDYGNVPQNRERVYIVGFKSKAQYEAFEFPKTTQLKKTVLDMLEKDVPEKYYYTHSSLYSTLKDSITKEGVVYQWRRKYVRENKSGVCPTLTANMGMGGHNVPLIKDDKGIRKLTPRECARFQGFPDSYKLPKELADTKLYKQFGNSVTVTVIEKVAKELKKALESNSSNVSRKTTTTSD
jgi:DNA (cytosine-5)-methyltransferase 1